MLARSVTLNFLGQTGTVVVGFASSVLLARLLGPSDRGLLALLASVSSAALVLGGIGIPLAVAYLGSLRERASDALFGNSLAWASLLAIVLVPPAWLFHHQLAAAFARGRGGMDWVLAAALVPITFLDYTTQNQVLGQHRFARYNLIIVLSKVGGVVAVVVLLGEIGLGLTGGLLSLVATSTVVIGLSTPAILREGRPRLDRALLRRMLGYGSRVQVGSVFQILNYRLDVVILQFFRPLRDVGYYVIAQIIAELVTTLSAAFATSVLPIVAREDPSARTETTAQSLRHHGALSTMAVLANAVLGPLVILVAYGPAYRPAIIPMLIILPGIWFLGTAQVVMGDLRGRDRPGLASFIAGGAAAATVVLDVSLIPPLGVDGAALASLVTYTLFGTASLVVLSRVSGIALRELAVPGRAELTAYRAAFEALRARLRRGVPASSVDAP